MADVQYVTLYLADGTPVQVIYGTVLYQIYLASGAALYPQQTPPGSGIPTDGNDPFSQYTTAAELAAALAALPAPLTAAQLAATSELTAAAVAAIEDAATVTPTGTWDFEQTPSVDGAPIRSISDTERAKLSSITAGATANSTDAQLRDRATHTGTQPATTISDFAEVVQDSQVGEGGLGNKLTKVGIVIPRGAAGQFDNLRTESLQVTYAPDVGRFAGVYTGYGDNIGGVERPSIGLAWSDDGFTFTKAGMLLGRTGTAGTPDVEGATGPVLVYEPVSKLYHLFYIGVTATGYEAGTKTLCLATSPSLTAPVWTRRGMIMAPGGSGWRAQAIWHPSIIKVRDTWYCFINASGSDAKERIGYATAPSLTGPWTFDDVNSPLIDVAAGDTIVGDPCVTRVPDGFRMDFFRAGASASDYYAVTSAADFPLGWKLGNGGAAILSPGPAGSYDSLYAHKPTILKHAGRTFHYYTAVDTNQVRQCALAIDPPKWSTALQPIPELTAARATTSTGTTWTTAGQSTVLFDPTGRVKPQFRILFRANPSTTTINIRDSKHPSVVGTLTGNAWANSKTAWIDIPETALFESFIEFQSANGTSVQIGNLAYEYRWIDAQS